MEKMTVRLQFWLCISKFLTVQNFITIKLQAKKLSFIKIFTLFVSVYVTFFSVMIVGTH